MNGKQFIGSTIVLTYDDGTGYNYEVECKIGLTGFKWIAKMIKDSRTRLLLVVAKKAGYLVGDAVRDKDAVAATLLVCDCCLCKSQRKLSIQRTD
jgi:phosphomannomutase